jgi:hypothetical protein
VKRSCPDTEVVQRYDIEHSDRFRFDLNARGRSYNQDFGC